MTDRSYELTELSEGAIQDLATSLNLSPGDPFANETARAMYMARQILEQTPIVRIGHIEQGE